MAATVTSPAMRRRIGFLIALGCAVGVAIVSADCDLNDTAQGITWVGLPLLGGVAAAFAMANFDGWRIPRWVVGIASSIVVALALWYELFAFLGGCG